MLIHVVLWRSLRNMHRLIYSLNFIIITTSCLRIYFEPWRNQILSALFKFFPFAFINLLLWNACYLMEFSIAYELCRLNWFFDQHSLVIPTDMIQWLLFLFFILHVPSFIKRIIIHLIKRSCFIELLLLLWEQRIFRSIIYSLMKCLDLCIKLTF